MTTSINTKNNTTINNITAKEEKENKMNNIANITKTVTAPKTTVELIKETNAAGVQLEYLAIDGVKIGTMGYTSQKDREAAIKFIQRIVDNSQNTGYALYMEIMNACMTGAAMTEEGIEAKDSEELEIEGVPVIINYEVQKAYIGVNKSLEAVADLEDLDAELPEVAVKALLVERAKTRIKEMQEEAVRALEESYDEYDPEEDYYDEYDDDYDDDYDNDTIVMGIRMR